MRRGTGYRFTIRGLKNAHFTLHPLWTRRGFAPLTVQRRTDPEILGEHKKLIASLGICEKRNFSFFFFFPQGRFS